MRRFTLLVLTLLTLPSALATLTDELQDDAKSGGDAGDTPDAATPLPKSREGSVRGIHQGMVVLGDDPQDWYVFQMGEPGKIVLDARGGSPACSAPVGLTHLTVLLLDPSGAVAAVTSGDGCGPLKPLIVESARPGPWRIGVDLSASGAADPGAGLPVSLFTTSEGSALALEYQLALDCEPLC